ncbi:MAG: tyrosine-protein phosphatase [Lacipirellulaceae bacterium]
MLRLVDLHCHLLPGLDDGPRDHQESIAMALLSRDQGIDTIIATPHQLGSFGRLTADDIRRGVERIRDLLRADGIAIDVLPGADVWVEEGLVEKVLAGEVLTLGDQGRHVLLEMPHDRYTPIDGLLDDLDRNGLVGVLTQPERNGGLLRMPGVIDDLVDRGCLMQVTAGSFLGASGPASQALAERMAKRGAIHFVATDAHGAKSRRPRLAEAFQAVAKIAGAQAARLWFSDFPRAVAGGEDVPRGAAPVDPPRRSVWSRLLHPAA